MPSWHIFPVTIVHTLSALFQPVFWLVVGFIFFQYWQMQKSQRYMFGEVKYSVRKLLLHAIGYGIAGGLAGSFLLLIVGVPLNNLGFEYLWPVALMLTLVNMRYICFAYAGGLVCLSSVLFGWPAVHVPSLIALVAILHATESFLIAISGKSGAVPLIMRTEQGKLVGGFQLLNFWPLPLTILQSVVLVKTGIANSLLKMPSWWPLIKHGTPVMPDQVLAYIPMAVVAALGYSDMAVTSHPATRRRQSAKHLFLYSITLLIVAVLANRFHVLQLLAALLAPLGHEYLIWLDNKREQEGEPLFQKVADGVMVLDTFRNTPAAKLGLQPGDVILQINSIPVYTRMDIAERMLSAQAQITLKVRTAQGVKNYEGIVLPERRLGVITVPEGYESNYVEIQQDSLFTTLKQFGKRVLNK